MYYIQKKKKKMIDINFKYIYHCTRYVSRLIFQSFIQRLILFNRNEVINSLQYCDYNEKLVDFCNKLY